MITRKTILGIDPGTNILGYGVIAIENTAIHYVDMGVVKMNRKESHYDKLKDIYHGVQDLIERFDPIHLAIEAPFYGKNVQSMLKLGRAQGVAMAAGITMGVPITEYSPKKIKMSITGNGNATKEQVAAMLDQTFKQTLDTEFLDASDALATALCHHYQRFSSEKTKNWSSFIKNNPGRVRG